MRPPVVLSLALILRGSQLYGATFPESGPTIASSRAALRNGIALAPADAPLAVKRAIWAANQLRSKPYRYGGGHRSFRDSGYDCSGTVSYALGGAGLISSPLSSSDFRRYGERGQGRWITVYARNGHTFAVIARSAIRYDPRRKFEVSLGAALANEHSWSGRLRGPASNWAIEIHGLPAWPNCSPATLCGAVVAFRNGTKSA